MSSESFIRRLAAPSVVLTDSERRRTSKLCEVLKAFLADRRQRWLRQHEGIPILEAYSSDGTPLKTALRHTVEFEQLHATRSGASSKEWL